MGDAPVRFSLHTREGAEVKPQPEVCGSWPHAKLRAHFHSPTLSRELKLPLLGFPPVPLPQHCHSPVRAGIDAPDVSPVRGTLRNMEHKGCFSMEFATGVCPQIPGGNCSLRGSQGGSQSLPSQQHTWRASHCPTPGLGREDGSGPGKCCQVAVLSITSATQTAVWNCPLITPQKGGSGTGWWWTLTAHRFREREKHRRDVHACADLSQPSSPMVQRAVPQLSWELPDLELGKGFSAMS